MSGIDDLIPNELKFIKKHRRKCNEGIATPAWFGLQWANSKYYTHIICLGCNEEYIVDKAPVGSGGASQELQTKNFAKKEKHEKDIPTRKIGKWKVRSN